MSKLFVAAIAFAAVSLAGCGSSRTAVSGAPAGGPQPAFAVRTHYILFYEVAPDFMERRPAFRDAHLAHARRSFDAGAMLIGGALAEPTDQVISVFQGESPAAAEAFAKEDPYVLNGLVTRWSVRPWSMVILDDIEIPLAGEGS